MFEYAVSFGDRDPVGIVFYPRTYASSDAAGDVAVMGTGVRGLFKVSGDAIVAGEIEALRRILDSHG